MESSPSRLARLLLVGCLAGVVVHAASYLDLIVDDSYIYFRFAAQLARGHGLVFNPGERVEGHSSTLWTLLLGGYGALGLDIPTAARWTGIGLGVLAAGLSWVLARRLGAAPLAALAAPGILALSPAWALWSAAGMPMPLLVFLLLACFLAVQRELAAPTSFPWSGPLLAVTALARPESFVYPFLFVAFTVVHGLLRDGLRGHRRQALLRAVFALGGVAAFLLWRHGYYGYWLSNATYAKLGGEGGVFSDYARAQAWHGWRGYLEPFLGLHLALGIPALLALPGWLGMRRRPAAWLALGLAAFQALLILKAGGDWMPMWRFLLPALALFAPFLAAGLSRAAAAWRSAPPPRPAAQTAVLVLALLAAAHGWLSVHRALAPRLGLMREAWAAALREAPRLRETIPPGETVASCAMGVVPWVLLENPFLDMVGLCNEHIAHHGRRALGLLGLPDNYWEKADPDWVFGEARPDWVLIVRSAWPGGAGSGPPSDERVEGSDGGIWTVAATSATNQLAAAHPLFQRDYELVAEVGLAPRSSPAARRIFVYRRRAG